MPKLSTDDRFARTMKFLIGSAEPQIASLLSLRGFDDEDRQEGWHLLDVAAGRHLAVTPGKPTFSPQYKKKLEMLDDWENTWFDVADAALTRAFPEVHTELFQNLSKVSGSQVMLSVKTFTARLAKMAEATEGSHRQAIDLLAKRGLNQERLDEAVSLLHQLEHQDSSTEVESPVDHKAVKAAQQTAIKTMWAWFQDWAKTARTVVKNRNYQIMLGLVPSRSSGGTRSDSSNNSDELDE